MNKTGADIQRKLQLSKRKNAVTLAGFMGGERLFNLKTRGGIVKKCILNGDILSVDGQKQYRLTNEQVTRFMVAEETFNRDYASAKRQDGFVAAEYEGDKLYVRRDDNGECQIFLDLPNGDRVQHRARIHDFLKNLKWNFSGLNWEVQYKAMRSRMEKLLLQCGDDYIVKEVRYINGIATREEVDFLIQSDGKPRFFVAKSEYGVKDINLLSVRKRPRAPLNPYDLYIFSFVCEGMVFDGYYGGKGKKVAAVADEGACPDIVISGELADKIRAVGDKRINLSASCIALK